MFSSPIFSSNSRESVLSMRNEPKVFHITRTWNNETTDHNITITLSSKILSPSNEEQLLITVDAPFFDDPHIPDNTPRETYSQLWDLEVVEVFLLGGGSDQHYLEIELSPKGQYLLLELKGYRNVIRDRLPLYKNHYNTSINTETKRWQGEAIIPNCYLPHNISAFNSYAIHGTDPNRVYMSLFPTPEGKYTDPDFHRLDYFQPINFQEIIASSPSSDCLSAAAQLGNNSVILD